MNLKQDREGNVVYVTRYISAASAPDLPQISQFPGLLLLQCAEDHNGKTEITVYWKSQEAARSNGRPFEETINAGAPSFTGYLRQLKFHEKSWWQRIPLGRWLLYSASLFGALTVLQTHFAKLAEVPDVVIEIPGPSTLEFLAGEEVSFDTSITNRSREVYAKATLSKPQLENSKGTIVEHRFWLNEKPAPIAPSEASTVPVMGAPLPKGEYTVTIAAIIEAGSLRDTLPISVKKSLQVWSHDPETIELSSNLNEDGRGVLTGRILVGMDAPNGLSCQVSIERRPGMKIDQIDFPGVHTWDDPVGETGVTTKFRTIRHFGSFSKVPFEITLITSSVTEDWDSVYKASSVDCEILEKE